MHRTWPTVQDLEIPVRAQASSFRWNGKLRLPVPIYSALGDNIDSAVAETAAHKHVHRLGTLLFSCERKTPYTILRWRISVERL